MTVEDAEKLLESYRRLSRWILVAMTCFLFALIPWPLAPYAVLSLLLVFVIQTGMLASIWARSWLAVFRVAEDEEEEDDD